MNKLLPTLCFLLMLAVLPVYGNHLSSSLLFTARLNGAAEVPEVVTDAQGVAMFSLDAARTTLYVNASFSALSGPITGTHIHLGAPGENGGVVIDLTSFLNGNRLKGAVRDINATVISNLMNGNYYINVHTEANPGGEIRGQISLEADQRYSAELSGTNEVPEVITDGAGIGIFQLSANRSTINFKVLFRGLSSAVTGAHLHNAPAGENGGVVLDLMPFLQGNTIAGSFDPAAILDAMLAGEIYINIHTENNPGGEIRGQVVLMPGLTFDASLDGLQESPAVTTAATGLGLVTLSPDLAQLSYHILFDSLSSAITASHFHQAAAGFNGGVVINLTDHISGNFISGTTDMPADLINVMLRGGLYINVHSTDHPAGEIRGQVFKFAREPYTFEINGGQEVPAVTTTGTGAGMVTIDRDQSNAHYMVVVSGLEGTFSASHFHNAGPGENGGVIYELTDSFNDFGGAYGYWTITDTPPFDASPLFINGDVYINVHTDLHPGGEVRGNIIRSSNVFSTLPKDPGFSDHLVLSALLLGSNENPPVTTDAVAIATLSFDSDKNTGHINITATGLSGPITGVHVHEGDPGSNGPVLYPLTPVGNRVQETIAEISDLDITSVLNGATYVNIHTAANPAGEIRGQLNLEQDLTFTAFLTGDQENPEVVTEALGLASIHYTFGQSQFEINVQLTNLSSEITGAHFHSGQPGENGPVIIDLSDLIDGNRIQGLVDITIDDLIELANANVYLNVHTTDNPGGEIRGHLNFLPGLAFDGWMSPLQEVPFTTSEASGLAVGTVYPGLNDIALWMLVDNASGPIAATHLHNAPLLENGGVVVDLTESLTGNGLIHLGTFDDGILSEILTGNIYINAHTAAFPGGELRGQLFRLARDGYAFDLCPDQEVEVVTAPTAAGSAYVSVDRNLSNLNIGVVVDGLTGPLTSSHIHAAPQGVNGSVIADLTDFYVGNAMAIQGATADTSIINAIRTGDTYINVHTAAHPAGEVRGQIVTESLCELNVGIDPLAPHISTVLLSPVPVMDQLQVEMNVLDGGMYAISISDITGRILVTNEHLLSQGVNQIYLPTADLTSGVYALYITNGKAGQAFKFVK